MGRKPGSTVGAVGVGDSGWDCCACVEQKALITEILLKAGEEVLKAIQWRNKQAWSSGAPLSSHKACVHTLSAHIRSNQQTSLYAVSGAQTDTKSIHSNFRQIRQTPIFFFLCNHMRVVYL